MTSQIRTVPIKRIQACGSIAKPNEMIIKHIEAGVLKEKLPLKVRNKIKIKKKLKSGLSTESFLAFYNFEYSKFLNPPMVKPFRLTYLAKGGGGGDGCHPPPPLES